MSDIHQGSNVGNLVQAVSDLNATNWDIALNLGDDVAPNGNADDTGYSAFIAEFSGLANGHTIDDVYHIMGNSDATVKDDPAGANFHFQKWCDPFGLNTAYSGVSTRPYQPIGSYDAYYLSIGNMIVICMSDRNDDDPPGGENGQDRTDPDGRRAGGAWTRAQWNFLKSTVENNKSKIIIVCSHQTLKDTSIGSGWGEFVDGHHIGRVPVQSASRTPDGTGENHYFWQKGYIGYLDNAQGTINTTTGDSDATDEIKTWMQANGAYIDLWLTAHYHTHIGEAYGGRTRYEQVYNTNFLNVSSINHNLGWYLYPSGGTSPIESQQVQSKSNLIAIDGDQMNVKTYIHYDPTSTYSTGYYAPEELNITLKAPFREFI